MYLRLLVLFTIQSTALFKFHNYLRPESKCDTLITSVASKLKVTSPTRGSVRRSRLTSTIVISLLSESMKVGFTVALRASSGQIMNYHYEFDHITDSRAKRWLVIVLRWDECAENPGYQYVHTQDSYLTRGVVGGRPSVPQYITGTMEPGDGRWRWSQGELISHLWQTRQAFLVLSEGASSTPTTKRRACVFYGKNMSGPSRQSCTSVSEHIARQVHNLIGVKCRRACG